MVALRFDAVVVLALPLAFENDEARAHVRVAVRHDRAVLLAAENLLAEAELGRHPLHVPEVDAVIAGAVVGQFFRLLDVVEFDGCRERFEIDPLI